MTRHNPDKSERALQLHEQGLKPAQIAERLGTTPGSASAMINAARARREKEAARADQLARAET